MQKSQLFIVKQKIKLIKNMKAKRGRPKAKTGEAKGTFFAARFNQAETKILNDAIKKSKKSKSDWIREKLLGDLNPS